MSKIAWVLAGGGAAGSYQVGVMRALLEGGIKPDALYGTSAGALNAFGLSYGGIDNLENMWRSISGKNDVLTENWAPILFGNGLNNADPLKNLLVKCRGDNSSTIPFSVFSLDLNSFNLVRADSPSPNILDYTIASSSIPILIEPKEIDGYELVDGGIIDNLPLRQAVADGFDEIYAINCFNDAGEKAPIFTISNKLVTVGLKALSAMRYQIYTFDSIYKDIAQAEVNLHVITPINQVVDVMDFVPSKIAAGIAEGLSNGKAFLASEPSSSK